MVIVDCIVLHYMHIWHLRIRASSLQFRASKINMALARMDKLVKKLMSNPALYNNVRPFLKISSVSLKRFPARILKCCCKRKGDLTCKTNILYGTHRHVENPEIKKKSKFYSKKRI